MIETAKNGFFLVVAVLIVGLGPAVSGKAAKGAGAQAGVAPTPAPTVAFKADANGVILFDKDTVTQAFAKGATLYNGNAEGRNYRVHTLRRVAPGEVELHVKDTDIFYIVDGSATFLTGGAMIDGRDTAPDEKRGKSMNGGTTYHLSGGNVVIIPAGVTHWFKEIQQPVTYLTIKVR